MQRTGGENHLPCQQPAGFPPALDHLDTCCTALLDQDAPHARFRQKSQVGTAASLGVEVGHRGRDAPVVEVVDRDREGTGPEVLVLIFERDKPLVEKRVGGGTRKGRPVVAHNAPDRQRPVLSVSRAVEVDVALQFAKVRKDAGPIPSLGTERGPLVVVGRLAAVGHHPVDTRSAAHHTGLLVPSEGTGVRTMLR